MGGLFTAVRVGVAFVCGILSGFLVDRLTRESDRRGETTPPVGSCCSGERGRTAPDPGGKTPGEALRYGFVTLPADLAGALVLGLLLAGLISTVLPPDLFQGALSGGPLAFLVATAISLPLYVCATGSIPMAYALIAAGLSPGAALVFLIVGPATNTATVVAVWKMLGRKATLVYLGCLVAVSWMAGYLFNAALGTELIEGGHYHTEAFQPALWQNIGGLLLLALLAAAMWLNGRTIKNAGRTGACCGG